MDNPAVMTSANTNNNNPMDADVGSAVLFANERVVVRKAGRQAIADFLGGNTCFSVLRASGKVVVFDVRIPIQLAFYALVEHDMQAAPLWDPSLCQFVGILTVTDFIDILRHYRKTGADPSTLGTRSIAEILSDSEILHSVLVRFDPHPSNKNSSKSITHHHHTGRFLAADPSTTLQQACHLLHQNSLDFLPIIMTEDMRVLACISYTTILEFLVTHFREQRRLFDDTVLELGIGTYHENLVTSPPTDTLADALDKLYQHGLSALPVVETSTSADGKTLRRLIGVYSRSDITFLASSSDAADAIHNMELTLGELLQQQRNDVVTTPDAMHTCTTQHTLQSIFEYFAQIKFNRLFVLDENESLIGVVSARDLVAYFLGE